MELLNIFNKIADSNLAYYLLIIILIIVVIAMLYLIASQNKEIREAQKRAQEEDELEEKSPVEELAEEIKEEKEEKEEQIDRTAKIPIHDSVLEMVNNDEEKRHVIIDEPKERFVEPIEDDIQVTEEDIRNYYGRHNREAVIPIEEEEVILPEKEEEPMYYDEEKVEHRDDIEKVAYVEDVDLSKEKKEELLDATLTNIPKVPLLEQTMTNLPPLMDYLDNTQDLMDLTKELEVIPKKKTIELTPFEEEQEQNAIISYDELIENKDSIQYKEEENKDDISIKEVDLEETTPKEEVETYEHEENFLARLKSIQGRG